MEKEKATIVLFSGDMDRALAAFNISVAAASLGMEVEVFFTFWGLGLLASRPYRLDKGSPLQRLLGLLSPGTPRRARLSRLNMAGLGKRAMLALMGKYRMPSLEELMGTAKSLGVRFVACTTTMALMGLEERDLPAADGFAGAASYVARASESRLNLFI